MQRKTLSGIILGRFSKEVCKSINKSFLIFAFVVVSIIAFLYGISPTWFAETFLNVPAMSVDFAHILRAIMGLYLGLGLFWLFSAFNDKHRNTAVLTTVIFAGGLVTGRLISLLADGWPSPILVVYVALEFLLIPVAVWVFELPE
ncbi:MAG: DUF4345 domain-containing protein [Schlesneria sp.]